jgi:hypothetical protein
MYACMHIRIYVYMYVCMYVERYIHKYYVLINSKHCVCVCVCVCVCARAPCKVMGNLHNILLHRERDMPMVPPYNCIYLFSHHFLYMGNFYKILSLSLSLSLSHTHTHSLSHTHT